MPVENSRQNKHGWWGTLTIDEEQLPLKLGQLCIFAKNSSDSHHVMPGTYVSEVGLYDSMDQAIDELANAVPSRATQIRADFDPIKANPLGLRVVKILKIDQIKTPPLTKALNAHTKVLFKASWLADNEAEAGGQDIEAGMSLPPLS